MDQRTELKREIEDRRSEISRTVDQMENRVNPGHVAARQTYRIRRAVTEWRDKIMGSDQTQGGLKNVIGEVTDTVSTAPDQVMARTRGNPLAAGVIAFGAGALIASLLPETPAERKLAATLQPGVHEATSRLTEAGRNIADDLKGDVRAGVENIRESAASAAQGMMEQATDVPTRNDQQ
jgi:uncharacterized protein YjbJ (UPF0337 family)